MGGAYKAIAIIRQLKELGMEVVITGTQTGKKEEYQSISGMLKEGTIIIDDANPAELEKFLREMDVDVMAGGVKERFLAYKLGIGFVDHNHDRKDGLAGFEGAVKFAHEVYVTTCSPVWKQMKKAREELAAMSNARVKMVNENQCQMCMPLGGVIAFKGIENAMVLVHGSQGCSTYMRLTNCEHYNEPFDIASTSLNEKQTIYGGEENLRKAMDNVIRVYKPKVLGVVTTCLAETIGEDMERMVRKYVSDRNIK